MASRELSAANVLKIGQYQVQPNTNIVIQLEADNSDPFVAFQVDIPIPAGFSYIEGSAQLNVSRSSGHLLSANLVSGNILRLIGFSVSNTAFLGNTGSLANFTIKSRAIPATFLLNIDTPLLGNNKSINILTGATNGDVTVLAPNIKLSATELNFGRVPLESNAEQSFQISNEGNRDLVVSNLNFTDTQFSTSDEKSFTIVANSSRNLTVKFTPTSKGTYAKKLEISSNDPDQPLSTLLLKAVAYAVNEVHTGNIVGASASTGTLEFTLNNMEAFTGFQFDLTLPQPMTYTTGSAHLFRSSDHSVTVNQIDPSTLRVLAFSGTNKNFTGNIGKILSLGFNLKGVAGTYPVGISNVIIASTLGDNIISAFTGGNLQITSPDIDASTQLNFGDVSILSNKIIQHRIYNYGQEPLVIDQLMFSNGYFKSNQTLPVTIGPSDYYDLPVEFIKATKGAANGTLKLLSNDPDENPFTIQLSANSFAPNYLTIKDQTFTQGESKIVQIEIENEEQFVAFQFDLSYPEGFTPDLNAIILTSRKQDHFVAASALSETSLRIIAYSFTQKAFNDKTGAVLNIPFSTNVDMVVDRYNLTFSNALISNIQSENILYGSTNGTLIVQKLSSLQEIPLIAGWNIISANVVPANLNLKDIFQPHINSGNLKKVMDEAGKTVENFGIFGGWKNNIGNLTTTEGYKVNMGAAATLSLEGTPVPLPFDIPLSTGWNIISYPCTTLQDGKALIQSLINAGKIIKVMDESGKTIENFGIFGGWKNNIGNFVPGKGYKVNVTADCTLTFTVNAIKVAAFIPEVLASTHFIKVFDGNGTDHMNISLVDLQTTGLQVGDEIGIFDGKYCVGAATIGEEQMRSGSISIPTSANEGPATDVNGFTNGNNFGLQLYRGNTNYNLDLVILAGNNSFEKNGSVFVKVSANDLPVVQVVNDRDLFTVYPNPFTSEITIEVWNSEKTEVDVAIFSLLGQRIKNLYNVENQGQLLLKWDGTNDSGQKMVPGIYLCKVNNETMKVFFKDER
jgi:hypothetical protein